MSNQEANQLWVLGFFKSDIYYFEFQLKCKFRLFLHRILDFTMENNFKMIEPNPVYQQKPPLQKLQKIIKLKK